MCRAILMMCLFLPFFWSVSANGSVTEYTNKAAWQNAVGEVTTITFTGSENGTPIVDQYIQRGVVFTSPTVFYNAEGLFPNDGWGAFSLGPMRMSFTQPMNWVAIEHSFRLFLRLYVQGEMIYETGWPGFGPGTGSFAGLLSDTAFDEFEILDDSGPFDPPASIFIDDLHFGPSLIPAPGALGLFGLVALALRRRRRLGSSWSPGRSF